MPSKTSFFKTLLRSDWRHYWPVAFSYTLIWIIGQSLSLWQTTSYENDIPMAQQIEGAMAGQAGTAWLCAAFAVLAAMAVWSYLMKSASVQFMHSLPVPRFTQFAAHYTAGLSLLTAGHVLTFFATVGVMAARGAVEWSVALRWILLAELTVLLFFSLATLCAQITGWLLAVPVFYAGLNCVVIVFTALVQSLTAICGYWGYSQGNFPGFVYWLTPLYQMTENYGSIWQDSTVYSMYDVVQVNPAALPTAAVYGIAGAVLAAGAYVLYKRRASETAGDAVSFRRLRPVVKWVIALCGGMGLGLFVAELLLSMESITSTVVFMCLFGVLCYIAVEMLLRKKFKVFTRRVLLGCGALCAVLIVLCTMLQADVFQMAKRMPAEENVQSVTVSASNCYYGIELEEPEQIRQVLAIHKALIDLPEAQQCPVDGGVYFSISYTMKNGTKMSRSYQFSPEKGSALHTMLNDLCNAPAVREQHIFSNGEAVSESHIDGGYIYFYDMGYEDGVLVGSTLYGVDMYRQQQLTEAQAKALYAALRQDAASTGDVDILDAQTENWVGCNVDFSVRENNDNYSVSTDFSLAECPEALQLLEEYGIVWKISE